MADLTLKIASVYTKVLNRFFDNTDLEFLKIDEDTDAYSQVWLLSDSWFLTYDRDRQKFKVEVAINEDDFNGEVVSATHIKVNDDIYVITQADTVRPFGIDFTWKFYCDRFFNRNQVGGLI